MPAAERALKGILFGDTKEAIGKFGPLRAVLGAIPAVYANREVRRKYPSQIPPLTNKFSGIHYYWEEN